MKVIVQLHYLILIAALSSLAPNKAWSQSDDSMSESEISDMVDDISGGMTDPGFTAPAKPAEYEPSPVAEAPERVDDEDDVDQEIGQAGGATDALHESAYRSGPTPEPWIKKSEKKAHKVKKSKKWTKTKKGKKAKVAKLKKKSKKAAYRAAKKSPKKHRVASRKPSARLKSTR